MTKKEWLREHRIHICKPTCDLNVEADEEFINDWLEIIKMTRGEI